LGKILILKKELTLTYSWNTVNHGICGHTFEVVDYYLLLKNIFDVGILLAEDITWETFQKAIKDKYDLTKSEIEDIKENTTFQNRPSLVKGKNILFTDGSVNSINQLTLLFDNVFMFACGYRTPKDFTKGIILQDNRLYPEGDNTIDYIKKINFDKYKKKVKNSSNTLLYGTKNCRKISDEVLKEFKDRDTIILTEDNTPYENLFDNFGTYVYTEVPRHWDCSPRFLAECKFYNKNVILHNIDYLEEDLGLKYRLQDIENNFESLHLNNNDDIIKILKEYL